MAAVNQAGLVEEVEYEFTSLSKVFEKRFEAFQIIRQPPPLTYSDYQQGSSFSNVNLGDLLKSTAECFKNSKAMVDKLESQLSAVDSSYLSIRDADLRQFTKVSIGNSVYVQKLTQLVGDGTQKSTGEVSFSIDPTIQFCTVKIS
eukprot:scaffold1900_cov123-Cylindrotheca_fusiformis.AAC.36